MSSARNNEESAGRTVPSYSDPTSPTFELSLTAYALRQLAERYEVLAEVGRGGMGIVYKAHDRLTGELVALKILNPDIAVDETAIGRFKNELRLARRITHKNVCRTHEFLLFGQTAVIVMEYVEGESLRHILSRFHGVSLRCAREWAAQICAALVEAHAQGIVHRDLKPENILIAQDGAAKVMDFGIACGLTTAGAETGIVSGTPGYMSPEQAEGKPTDVRSDIYSLGLILYEMFTGERVFRSEATIAEILDQMRNGPPAARSIEPDLPERIEKLLQRCLQNDPNRRFQSVKELDAALTGGAVSRLEQFPVELPRYLLNGRRSDLVLFLFAAFGLAGFLLLANSIFPESDVQIRLTGEMALNQARQEVLRRGCGDAMPSVLAVKMDDGPYNFLAERFGYEAGRRALETDFPPILFNAKLPLTIDPTLQGDIVVYDSTGSLRSVELPVVQCVRPGSGLPREQAFELAKDEVQRTFHVDAAKLSFEHEEPLAIQGRLGNSFRWMRGDSSRIERHYQVDVFDRPTLIKCFYNLPEEYSAGRDSLRVRTQMVLISWSAVAFVLFFARRLYSRARPRVMALLAIVGLICALGIALSAPISLLLRLVLLLPVLAAMVIAWLIVVSVAVVFVMNRRWPHLTANYVGLIELQPDWRVRGLAVARGIGCGLILLGICSVLWQIGISTGVTWPKLGDYSELGSPFPSLFSFTTAFLLALVPAYMLGLLISPTRRWIGSVPLLCAIGGVLWVAQSDFSSLPGDWFLVLTFVIQGAAFCWVMIKFDLLTLIATTFTVLLLWHRYPQATMQESLEGADAWLPFALWGAVFAWSVFVGFRPLWERLGKRMTEALD